MEDKHNNVLIQKKTYVQPFTRAITSNDICLPIKVKSSNHNPSVIVNSKFFKKFCQ